MSGLLALHVLFKRAWPFTDYVAADPSIWWNNSAILAELGDFADAGPGDARRLLITTSGKRFVREGTSTQAAERMKRLRSGPNGRDVAERLSALDGLTVRYQAMPDEDHGSIVEPSLRMFLSR